MTIDAWRQMEDDLLGAEPEYDQPADEIPDLAEADKVLRRVARVRMVRDQEQDAYETASAQLDQWWADRQEHHARAEAYHLERLERYHRAVLLLDPKRKTIDLPSGGKLKARAQQPDWQFYDQTAYMAWAQVCAPETIEYPPPSDPRIERATAKSVLTRRDAKGKPVQYGVTADGVVPPGLLVVTRGDKFDVEVHGA